MIVPSMNDLKEISTVIGIPATVVISTIFVLYWGFMPFDHLQADLTLVKADMASILNKETRRDQRVEKLIEQHAEQMHNLNAALKEICINTAKNENRVYECLKIDGRVSQ